MSRFFFMIPCTVETCTDKFVHTNIFCSFRDTQEDSQVRLDWGFADVLVNTFFEGIIFLSICLNICCRERSGSVVECLTQVRASPASLRCGTWARHMYRSLILGQPRKTCPCLTERFLMGRKESNQTICLKICCGYSKEPSHWDGSFANTQHMFCLINMESNF